LDNVEESAWKNYFQLLAAALLDGLFEHPSQFSHVAQHARAIEFPLIAQ
jgi:hypothetical protein